MIWNIKQYIQILTDEFEACEKDNILQVAASVPESGYWDTETTLYFMAWYYALTTGTNTPERAARDNKGCPFCVQKTKSFIKELIQGLKDEKAARR